MLKSFKEEVPFSNHNRINKTEQLIIHNHKYRSALEETFVPTDSFRYESRPGKRSTTVTLAQLAHSQ